MLPSYTAHTTTPNHRTTTTHHHTTAPPPTHPHTHTLTRHTTPHHTRLRGPLTQVATSCYAGYAISFAVLLLLPLLPKQKEHAQERKRTRPRSPKYMYLTILLIGSGIVFSLTTSILSLNPSTECLIIAGGQGCPDALTPHQRLSLIQDVGFSHGGRGAGSMAQVLMPADT